MRPESWRLASLVVVVVAGLLLPRCGGSLSCQRAHENAHEADGCPVKTARHPSRSNCVTVRVWIQHGDLSQAPTIEIASLRKETIRPVFKYKRTKKKWHSRKKGKEIQVACHESSERPGPHGNATLSSWELLYDCVETEGRLPLTVSYSAASVRCSLNYTRPEAAPDFSLSVDRASKSINVTVQSESKVRARWCYKQSAHSCVQRRPSNVTVIDPSRSRSALLGFPYVLPCVCVQVCFFHPRGPPAQDGVSSARRPSRRRGGRVAVFRRHAVQVQPDLELGVPRPRLPRLGVPLLEARPGRLRPLARLRPPRAGRRHRPDL